MFNNGVTNNSYCFSPQEIYKQTTQKNHCTFRGKMKPRIIQIVSVRPDPIPEYIIYQRIQMNQIDSQYSFCRFIDKPAFKFKILKNNKEPYCD